MELPGMVTTISSPVGTAGGETRNTTERMGREDRQEWLESFRPGFVHGAVGFLHTQQAACRENARAHRERHF